MAQYTKCTIYVIGPDARRMIQDSRGRNSPNDLVDRIAKTRPSIGSID